MAVRARSLSLALAFAAVTLAAAQANAQTQDLYFSEYIEGSSNNKALEIFNPTNGTISLSGYQVQMFFNGATTASLTIGLTSTASIAAGEVYVLAQASASATILAQADQTNSSGWFNGDDAVALVKNGTRIDVIGQIGTDPGTEWGSGNQSTADNTLRRKSSVTAGDANGTDAFDPSVQWDGFATDNFDGLGSHGVVVEPPPTLADINEIQGSGLASPFANARVETHGNIVTGLASDGFFMQAPDADVDGDPSTSEGIFVFTSSAPTVDVGDVVDVLGTVQEFFNLTEIASPTLKVTGTATLPAVVDLDDSFPSPDGSITQLEPLEGMLVRITGGTTSAPSDQFGDFAVVAGSERPFREPGILTPGLPGLPVWDGNPEIFEIDPDGLGQPDFDVAAGSAVSAEGPLTFAFGDYQIWPSEVTVSGSIEVIPVRAPLAGEFTVGSQNMLRLFDTVNDPNTSDDVPSAAALALRLGKLSLQVRVALGAPDILAVQEVENLNVLDQLADRIERDDPSIVYTAYLVEGNDIGGIDVGFLVRDTVEVDSVTQIGKNDTFVFNGTTATLNDRPPLLLRASYTGNGGSQPIAVMAVHQRSLSGIDGTGTEAARIRVKRHEQAYRLSQYIQAVQTSPGGSRLVVIGDFNAFEFTDGYVDVMGQVTGNFDPLGAMLPGTDEVSPNLTNQTFNMDPEERYSFVFDGSAQSLDHAVTSAALDSCVRDVMHARGNADSPGNLGSQAGTALRSADHDGTVVFLRCDDDEDGVNDDVDACLGTRIPEGVPTLRLMPNRFALVDGDTTFDTEVLSTGPPASFTIEDTRGCSCEQIVDQLDLGGGHIKFGCSLTVMRQWVALP